MVRRKSSPSRQVDDLYTSKVRHLTSGAWVEFLSSNGKATRAKLSWVSPINDTYLFTDQQGLKVGSYSLDELASLMRCARANILNTAPLMDRAVSSMPKDYE